MKSYVVRVYRFERKHPRSLVGVVEEVGVKGKRAFTNLDELWDILKSVKKETRQLIKNEITLSAKYKIERRNEVRIKKEIPFVFLYKKRNLDASTMNYSKNGLGIKIFKKVALPVGDTVNLLARDSAVKAQVMWVKKEIDPPITLAGLKIVDGTLNLKGARKNTGITMRSPLFDTSVSSLTKGGIKGGYGEITKYNK
jgi:hypothetical protein